MGKAVQKFKIGDVVRVREDLDSEAWHVNKDTAYIGGGMKNFLGTVAIVMRVERPNGDDEPFGYTLSNNMYQWCNDDLILVEAAE